MQKTSLKRPGTAKRLGTSPTLLGGVGVALALLLIVVLVVQHVAAASSFNNEGTSVDGAATSANYDGSGFSYSANALAALGFVSGQSVTVQGLTFAWPTIANGTDDNWQAAGQVITISTPGVTQLGFLGSATNGPSSGTVTLTYSDNSTQSFTLAFSDWTLNAGKSTVLPGDSIAATMSYRNTQTGAPQTKNTYLFFTSLVLPQGKTLASVTLPSSVSQGALHVFAVGISTTPFNNNPNNEGTSVDGSATAANYDGSGFSYSATALASAGFASGQLVTVNGLSFQWPTIAEGSKDNWQAAGQTIAVNDPNAAFVGFLGSATNGPSSGTVTLTYTDNTIQNVTLSFSDWTLNAGKSAVLSADTIVKTMSYRNTQTGAPQTKNTYLFFTSFALAAGKTLASVTLPTSVSQEALHVFAVGTGAGPQGTATWPTYMGDNARSGLNAGETQITSSTVANLKHLWSAKGGIITDQPIVGNNLIYWGSWDGYLHATNFAGTTVWRTFLGQTNVAHCEQPLGVAGSAALGTINGTPAVFISGGNAVFYALNALTGAIIWQTRLGASPATFLWSSPLIFNGSVYIGVASLGDCPLVQGKLIQLSESTGSIQHTLTTMPNGCVGAGIWGTPALDASSGVIYATTGNPGSCSGSGVLGPAVIAAKASNLALVSSWRVPTSQQVFDSDFGSTPTLFTATISGKQRLMVGVENKNGFYYAFDRTNLGAGPIWEDVIAPGGPAPEHGQGSISPSLWDGTTLYVAGGKATINGTACAGAVRAVNPATGAFKWQACITGGAVLAGITGIPGAMVVGGGTSFYVLDSSTGNRLFTFHPGTFGAGFDGPATVVNGRLYEGCADGNLYAFSL